MDLTKKIAVIGYGYVGKAMTAMLHGHYHVVVKDSAYANQTSNLPNVTFTDDWALVNACDLAVVCVPTPTASDGFSCDTSIVEAVIKELTTPLILIKSTVAIGTTDTLKQRYSKRIVFSPEYIGEGGYWSPHAFVNDMKATPFVIMGGDPADTTAVLDFLTPILGPTKTYRQTTARTAETVKYFLNTFFALKVTFANEMKACCDALGVDYLETRDLWALDPRVDKMHTLVFGDQRGYGGKCLPKDTKALIATARQNGYNPTLFEAMDLANDYFRGLNLP